MTHVIMGQNSVPAVGMVKRPTTSLMMLLLKQKISLDDERTWRQYVPKVHISTGQERLFCVDFYTCGR